MKARRSHQLALTTDRDVIVVAAVTLTATLATAGLLYVAYFAHVVRVARRAPIVSTESERVLVFGKFSADGSLDVDFEARIHRAVELHCESQSKQRDVSWVLLGGGEPGQLSEAEIAHDHLLKRGVSFALDRLHLEKKSRDTLQNLQNVRDHLKEQGTKRIALLTSRYHLARCQIYATQLGFESEVVAAETHLPWRWRTFRQLVSESALVMLSDVGAKWAKLTGNQRMLDRIS